MSDTAAVLSTTKSVKYLGDLVWKVYRIEGEDAIRITCKVLRYRLRIIIVIVSSIALE